MTSTFEQARAVADAVLYEGYLLYPYRASAAKNQARWQFGVLVPPSFAAPERGEHGETQTECVLDAPATATLHVRLRFLHVQQRLVQDPNRHVVSHLVVNGEDVPAWDETVEYERDVVVPLARLLSGDHVAAVVVDGAEDVEELRDADGRMRGRIVRVRQPLTGVLRISASPISGPYGGFRIRVLVANTTARAELDSSRECALRHSLVATHLLLGVTEGAFLSLVDPPEWARPVVEECENVRTWPVLLGASDRSDAMLSSPIILYDNPAIAPESPQPLFDGTEIDEILTLRTMALTEAEKRAARSTDPHARALLDGIDGLPAEWLERLHGTMRSVRSTVREPRVPWWDPAADESVSPDTDSVQVAGTRVAKGSRVRLKPGRRRTDAQDMFLHGRTATVQGVFVDVDDEQYLAVTLDEDPAAELQSEHGRFRYFFLDEIEPGEGGPCEHEC
ncbi:hypothetical protein [Saccharopolyspora phatthalungensis]|uniref:Uncharacterized protein n=1 Tax=Saccharopolyspora phatthalungensis TaxID=664693 RepID=A0A840Q1F9_9PSEU|nr:hypothetical protein [Saccharopolyspora phatthalungensis]MBB5152579.1 hypothetical protein [Saccharopolyspora phatthalungensis]